jgi:hypothetical protein
MSQKELLGLSTPGSQNSPENKKGLPSLAAFFVCARFAVAWLITPLPQKRRATETKRRVFS